MTILAAMADLAHKRNEQYAPDVRSVWFPVTHLDSLTWLGTYSWANPKLKRRFIEESIVIYDLFDVPQTPPEIARDYLRAKYLEYRRHTQSQFAAINEARSAPRYAQPGVYRDMAYVDLRAAYWSIIQAVGWDVDYCPGRWIGKRSTNEDFPIPDHKLARNCLVSAGLITPSTVWTGEKIKNFTGHNPLVNYDIWALCQDVLHALATLALKAGAVYVHTDGYIVPEKHAELLREEIAEWGIESKVKGRGNAAIYAVGCYKIGSYETKHKTHFKGRFINAVYEPDIRFLKRRIKKLGAAKLERWG